MYLLWQGNWFGLCWWWAGSPRGVCMVSLKAQQPAFCLGKAECLVQNVIKWLRSGLWCSTPLPQRLRAHSLSWHLKPIYLMTSKPPFTLFCPAFCQGCCHRVPEGLGRCSRTQWPPTPHEAGARAHRTLNSPVLLETALQPPSVCPHGIGCPEKIPEKWTFGSLTPPQNMRPAVA